ncbi:aldo/keto reductase [Bradyrhizobium prioriisuperbiae]|uniref:aldo/keto reductase n=1 Tax=Bradyrhizobium prioriisuperbiae TaxID=2854389 RepID=UPI0028E1F00B|nr:aldo/keto reductase [Bradyrhizobium prioritasuperba]
MIRRRLGKSDLHITPLGIGTWAMGGPIKNWGRGPQSDHDSLAAMERALDMGVNWIDTAPVYGIGHAEELVGTLLKRRAGGTRPLIFTKCGIRWDKDENYTLSLSEASLRRELEKSLLRLGAEVIDLYQIHTPSYPRRSPYKGGIEEAMVAMSRFRAEGKVREIGISNCDVPQIQAALSIAEISCLQPQYSLLQREVEQQVLPFCAQKGIGVIVYSPMHSGLLSGTTSKEKLASLPEDDWRRRQPDFQEPKLSVNLEQAERVKRVARRYGCTAAEIAVAWTLRTNSVTGAIVGLRKPEQVDAVFGAASRILNNNDIAEIEGDLIRSHNDR